MRDPDDLFSMLPDERPAPDDPPEPDPKTPRDLQAAGNWLYSGNYVIESDPGMSYQSLSELQSVTEGLPECPECFNDTPAHDPACPLATGAQGPQLVPWRTWRGPAEPPVITLPGVYQLDAREYHDPAITGDWLSNSDARQLIDDGCPAQFKYDRDHGVRQITDAFSMGHAVHARILGKGETIAVRPLVNPDDPSQVWDSWRTNTAKAWRAEQEAAGRSVILPEQAAVVEAMAAAVHAKPRAHELLSQPGRPEVALFWVDADTGVKRRALVDYLPTVTNPAGVMEPVDIKSADSVAPTADMERRLYNHAWHRQAMTITDGILALGLAKWVEFYFVVQSKTAPHLVTVVKLDAEAEHIGRIENRRALLVYRECLETGVWPDYADEPVSLSVPAWIARQYEDEMVVS